ncbi:asparagine synthase-related protein [[Eubacterium] cellulosolvens]
MNKLREDRFTPDFELGLLKAWLTLRFNPSARCFMVGRGVKNNRSRKLSVEDFNVERFKASAEKVAERLRTLLFEILRGVAKTIPQGERIGVLCSGGIDSTTLTAILCKLGYRPEGFTIGFGTEDDEIEAASVAAGFLGVEHHVRVLDKILTSTADANRVLDEPYRAACFYYDALKFVRDSGVRYVFDGLGVDEFLGGYDFRYQRVMSLVNSGMRRIDAYLRGSHPNDYIPSQSHLFGEKLRRMNVDWGTLLPYFENDLALIDQVLLADYNAKCRQNFIPLARFASPLGIYVFYPWLDDALIDFSMRVRSEWKYDPQNSETKILFRKAVQDLVPRSSMEKKKQGFGPTPSRVCGELRSVAEDIVLDGLTVSNGYVSKDYYREVLEKKEPSPVEINKLWDLYTLEVFLNEMRPTGMR